MAFYLLDGKTSIWVNLHNLGKNILAVIGETFGHLELPGKNFLIKLSCVFIFEGQVPGHHCKQNDAARPNVDTRAIVQLALNHFRCCVAGTATRRFKSLALFVSVAQTEINQLQVVLVIEKKIFRLKVSVHYS